MGRLVTGLTLSRRAGAGTEHRDRMANRKCIAVHQDLLHQQPQNRLTLFDIQGTGFRAKPCSELAERLHQAQVFGFVGSHRLQRLQVRFDRTLLFAQFRHSAAELIESHEPFLICRQ